MGDWLRCGFAQADITPSEVLPLAGIGRHRLGVDVLDPLRAKALLVDDGETHVLLLSLDVLWVSETLCDAVAEAVQAATGIPAEQVFVAATHTHGAPATREDSGDGIEVSDSYRTLIVKTGARLAGEALAAMTPCRADYGEAQVDLAVNRRRRVRDLAALKRLRWRTTVANRPNPEGPCDRTVPVLRLTPEPGGRPVYVLGAALHPSLWRGEAYSADYPGYLDAALGGALGRDVNCLFFQGFSGNLRLNRTRPAPWRLTPGGILGTIFDPIRFDKPLDRTHLVMVATTLAEAVAGTALRKLPKGTLQTDRCRAELTHVGGETSAVRVSSVRLGPGLILVGVGAELFCDYAQWLREETTAAVFPVGCGGGMTGYLPTDAALTEGGYEVERSLELFGLPGPFAPGTEERLKTTLTHCMRNSAA